MNQYRLSLDVSGLSGKVLIIKNRNQQTSNLDNILFDQIISSY